MAVNLYTVQSSSGSRAGLGTRPDNCGGSKSISTRHTSAIYAVIRSPSLSLSPFLPRPEAERRVSRPQPGSIRREARSLPPPPRPTMHARSPVWWSSAAPCSRRAGTDIAHVGGVGGHQLREPNRRRRPRAAEIRCRPRSVCTGRQLRRAASPSWTEQPRAGALSAAGRSIHPRLTETRQLL